MQLCSRAEGRLSCVPPSQGVGNKNQEKKKVVSFHNYLFQNLKAELEVKKKKEFISWGNVLLYGLGSFPF